MSSKRPNPGGGSGPPAKRPPVPPARADEDGIDEVDELDAIDADPDTEGMFIPDDLDADLDAVGQAGRNWTRPEVAPIDPCKDSQVFQQLEVDYTLSRPHGTYGLKGLPEAPVVRLYGVNEAGNSVCAFVHGFEPYFYAACPPELTHDDVDSFRDKLNTELCARKNLRNTAAIRCVSIERKRSIWGYQGKSDSPFLKIVTSTPAYVTPCRTILEDGFTVPSAARFFSFPTYESNVLYALRFMIDKEVVGANWVEVPAGSYQLATSLTDKNKWSNCQIDVHLAAESLISLPTDGKWAKLAPFRILSFDIECAGRKGHFPEADVDPVIQIASMITVQGDAKPAVKVVMTLGTCASIVGSEVMPFEREEDLLLKWRDLVQQSDPDIIIGYNICNFDIPYLVNRARKLKLDKFEFWGRIRNSRIKMRDAVFSSKAYGTHEYKEVTIEGRTQFDLLMAIQRDHKLSSYSLNSVSAHFLGEQKEDVHHSIISDLQDGSAEDRRRLAVYCLKDAYLPQRLVDKLLYMYNYIEMARVTGVPVSYLLTRGQSIKVFSQILRKCRQQNIVVPFLKGTAPTDGVAYEGATVLNPLTGFYRRPIATLDFASLYPSIMQAHNLCYSTLLTPAQAATMPPEHVIKTPSGNHFVAASQHRGLLPQILEELLAARKAAKKDMAAATDPFIKAVMNGRQMALKVSANSVYGFTGATVGKMCCLEISRSVTGYGRRMIEDTRDLVTATYTRAKGFPADCVVIYGDTDSVMVDFKVDDIAKAMELGEQAAEKISATFPHPVKLEFEKVYCPYLLMNKKRYAGLLYTSPEKYDKMDTKGIETVRRDNCLLVRNLISTCLDKLLIDADPQAAGEFVQAAIGDLLQNKIDLSELVVTKSLSQDVKDYKATMPHVALAQRMMQRDPATAPTIGDRVAYVIVKGAKGAQANEKAEDPMYVLDKNLSIDAQHYVKHSLTLPVLRLFEPVLGEKKAASLLTGDHTRTITVSTPSASVGGMMKFAKVTKAKCLNCHTFVAPGAALCSECTPQKAVVYQRKLAAINQLEINFSKLWSQCQRCQGSLHLDVLCSARDCPIFYRRKKAQNDLGAAQKVLEKFEDW